MSTKILHPDHFYREPFVPGSVWALDALLNRRVAEATTDAAVNQALAEKTRVKRRLVRLPEMRIIDAEARAILRGCRMPRRTSSLAPRP